MFLDVEAGYAFLHFALTESLEGFVLSTTLIHREQKTVKRFEGEAEVAGRPPNRPCSLQMSHI
jgi:hypothetical protein